FSRRLAPLELGDRAVDRADETAVTLRFRLDPCPVRLERGEPVEGRVIEDGGDLLQREAELAMQQDLLQPQELFFLVVAVAVVADVRGLEEADLVVMVQRADGDARELRKLLDGISLHRSCPAFSAGREQ